jgi:S-DNA-T family DNA segregation ATPase FtsK/SpoIIIE
MAKTKGTSSPGRLTTTLQNFRIISLEHNYEREVFFLAIIGISAFYITSLASYTPLDESMVAASFPSQQPKNLAGAIGANISGLSLFFFGIAAWCLPLPAIISSLLLVLRNSTALAKSRWLGWTLGVCCLSTLAAAQFPTFEVDGIVLSSGGVLGSTLATVLHKWLGSVGSYILIGTTFICSLTLITRRGLLAEFLLWLKKQIQRIRPLPNFTWFKRTPKPESLVAPAPERAVAEPSIEECQVEDISPIAQDEALIAPAPEPKHRFSMFPRGQKDKAQPKTPKKNNASYVTPPLSIFDTSDPHQSKALTKKELETTATLLVNTFEDFGVKGKIIGYQPGPVVTVFEFQPDAGVKQSKVIGLIDDLALALRVDSIFIHPVRGKRALGVQVPNTHRELVHLGDVIGAADFEDAESPLTFGMGKNINGKPMCVDLKTMPHLLAAGATGSGKSVAINTLLCSVIMKASPEDVRMILVDPKMLELSVYEGIPHLMMPVITEPERASLALKWAANEMERRYKLMQHAQVRNISGFNAFWEKASDDRKAELREVMNDESIEKLPYLLLVIDELADLMLTAPKDVESSIQRLAQKARASGIHMVLATQRPSVDVITGVIKANLPCRIAFQVVSKHDSRTILDLNGAEKLLGKGDMLLQRPGMGRMERVQGALITDEEVLNLVASAKASGKAVYDQTIVSWIEDEMSRQKDSSKDEGVMATVDDDPKWDEAITVAQTHGVISASFLQRHLKIGYNRAARIVEAMEAQNLIGKADGSKPRKWLGPGSVA